VIVVDTKVVLLSAHMITVSWWLVVDDTVDGKVKLSEDQGGR